MGTGKLGSDETTISVTPDLQPSIVDIFSLPRLFVAGTNNANNHCSLLSCPDTINDDK